jgi:transcriptional regulator with XRE-family HTH domain
MLDKISPYNISRQAILLVSHKLAFTMPKILNLPPLDYGDETIGQRLARIRKERGYTQVDLAKKVGIIQSLMSDYETNRLRLSADIAVRFALALNVSMDELLSPKIKLKNSRKPSLKIMRRMEEIEKLPPRKQALVLSALDSILRGAAS